jgi:hypothetical protein
MESSGSTARDEDQPVARFLNKVATEACSDPRAAVSSR